MWVREAAGEELCLYDHSIIFGECEKMLYCFSFILHHPTFNPVASRGSDPKIVFVTPDVNSSICERNVLKSTLWRQPHSSQAYTSNKTSVIIHNPSTVMYTWGWIDFKKGDLEKERGTTKGEVLEWKLSCRQKWNIWGLARKQSLGVEISSDILP